MRLNLFLILTLPLLYFSCDNTEIKPQFTKYVEPAEVIDSAYSSIKLSYSSGQTYILRVSQFKSYYNLFVYVHQITFTDGSSMTINTTYAPYTQAKFNATSGNSVDGYQGKYACMDLYDVNTKSHYDFRDQTNAVTVGATLYKNKYAVITLNNIVIGWPGYGSTKGTISGSFVVPKY